MIRSFTRGAALVCTAAALALTSAGAFAQATITLSDSNCSDFTLGGSAGARTLTCIVTSPPVCTVTGPTTGTNGTPITLSASCSPAANSWSWTGGNCAGVTIQTCAAVEAASVTRTYTVAGTYNPGNLVGSPSPGKDVVWSNTPPPPPSGCSISQSPAGTLPVGGGNVTLTADCTGGTGISWSWTGGFAQGLTTAVVGPGNVTTTTAFTATATNGGGVVATNYTVQVATGGGGGIDCTAQGYATTKVIDLTYGSNATAYTSSVGGFGAADAIVVRFTTSNVTTSSSKGTISFVEYQGPPTNRVGALSTVPCDFTVGAGINLAFANTNAATLWFTQVNRKSGYAKLDASTTYYLNIANMPGNCGTVCDMVITLQKPSGT